MFNVLSLGLPKIFICLCAMGFSLYALAWLDRMYRVDRTVRAASQSLFSSKSVLFGKLPSKRLENSSNSAQSPHALSKSTSERGEVLPIKFHIVWVRLLPLRPVCLAAIDSVMRHMPLSTVVVHVTAEEGIPEAESEKRQAHILSQVEYFRSRGGRVEIVFHTDVRRSFSNTPLSAFPFRQRHIGGVWGEDMHGYLGPHVADLMKIVIAYNEGGVFMDDDNILLHDLTPLFDTYGTAIITTDYSSLALPTCQTRICNGFFVVPARHPFIVHYMDLLMSFFTRDGVDYYFPRPNQELYGGWDVIGPAAATAVHNELCKSLFPPLALGDITPEAKSFLVENLHSNESLWKKTSRRAQRPAVNDNVSYVVMTRKYLIPAFWGDPDFLTQQHNIGGALSVLLNAFQFHIFGPVKWKFLSLLLEDTKYPLLHFMHQRSCRWLCQLKSWTEELPAFTFPES